jgi:hypothetical protein
MKLELLLQPNVAIGIQAQYCVPSYSVPTLISYVDTHTLTGFH